MNNIKDLLYFDHMVTPKIITFVYWASLVSILFLGFLAMFTGYGGLTFGKFIWGLFIIIFGCIGTRISYELLIVLFKIHENIKKIANTK